MSGNDFLWHKVSEEEKKKIQEQAKSIMESFSKKLSKLEKELKNVDVGVERPQGEREEGKLKPSEIDKDIMFKNAPEKNKDFIIAEKKGW